MKGRKGPVIHLHQRDPKEALARLNRITGLRFSQWPESLLEPAARGQECDPQVPCEPPAKVAPV